MIRIEDEKVLKWWLLVKATVVVMTKMVDRDYGDNDMTKPDKVEMWYC